MCSQLIGKIVVRQAKEHKDKVLGPDTFWGGGGWGSSTCRGGGHKVRNFESKPKKSNFVVGYHPGNLAGISWGVCEL